MLKLVVASDMDGSAGLDFEASLPDVDVSDTSFHTVMGTDTSVELRDKQKRLLLKLSGSEIDNLHRQGIINASRPDLFHKSVFNHWLSNREPPEAPKSFRLEVSGVKDTEQLIGSVKLLLDWLVDHQQDTVSVQQYMQKKELDSADGDIPNEELSSEPSSSKDIGQEDGGSSKSEPPRSNERPRKQPVVQNP